MKYLGGNKLAKCTVHAGLTLHIGHPSINEYGRLDVEIKDLDTSLPMEEQLDEAVKVVSEAWKKLIPVLDKQASEIIGVQIVRGK